MADDAGERARRAREALAQVKADALARGSRPAPLGPNSPKQGAASADSPSQGGGRRGRRDDPQSLTAAIDGLISEQGWAHSAAVGTVFGHWAQIVGSDLAAHTTPESLTDGELTIAGVSTAWATQVRLLAGQLVHRLNTELGDGSVRRVKVRGPASGPRPARGEWRVRGGRGPRDTYG
jgi:predicted nucleic acid-binding Zn ribbon protein